MLFSFKGHLIAWQGMGIRRIKAQTSPVELSRGVQIRACQGLPYQVQITHTQVSSCRSSGFKAIGEWRGTCILASLAQLILDATRYTNTISYASNDLKGQVISVKGSNWAGHEIPFCRPITYSYSTHNYKKCRNWKNVRANVSVVVASSLSFTKTRRN